MVDCCVSGLEMSWREVFPERRKTSSSATVRAVWDFSLSCLVVGGKWMIWYKHVAGGGHGTQTITRRKCPLSRAVAGSRNERH